MPVLKIICGLFEDNITKQTSGLSLLYSKNNLHIEGSGVIHQWQNIEEDRFILIGDVIGVREADGSLLPSSMIRVEIARLENPDRIPEIEGRFALVRISSDGSCEARREDSLQ